MKARLTSCFTVLVLALFACGSAGGAEPGVRKDGNVMDGLSLIGSRQGQSGGFADFDGDGVLDMITGAPYASGAELQGAVLVYKGGQGGVFSCEPTAVLAPGDDNYGFSYAGLVDADGGHNGDFAVSAINGSGTATSLCGIVYVYRGGGGGQVHARLSGEGPMDKFGYSLASGDLNDDGFGDLLVGAPMSTKDPAFYQGGAVYVFFGPHFTERVALYASGNHRGIGRAVASGDLNGDSIPDLLFSAGGKVLGFYGGASFAPSIDAPDVVIKCSAEGFGQAIAVLGDLDEDGKKEMAIGASQAAAGGKAEAGAVYIVKGGAGTRAVDLNNPASDLVVKIDGAGLFDRFGSTLVVLDSPGKEASRRLAVGAVSADADKVAASGKVYIFKEKDLRAGATLANAAALSGATKDGGYGSLLAASGDGRLMIGAPRSDGDTGRVYLIDFARGGTDHVWSSGGAGGANANGEYR